jgi:hypothetical protein
MLGYIISALFTRRTWQHTQSPVLCTCMEHFTRHSLLVASHERMHEFVALMHVRAARLLGTSMSHVAGE